MKIVIDLEDVNLKKFLLQSGRIDYNGTDRFYSFPEVYFKEITEGEFKGSFELYTTEELPEWLWERVR